MSTSSSQMDEPTLVAYVACHENEFVQQYVEALYEERAELTSQLESIVRRGYSDDGRSAMRRVERVLLVGAVLGATVIAFAMGRLSG